MIRKQYGRLANDGMGGYFIYTSLDSKDDDIIEIHLKRETVAVMAVESYYGIGGLNNIRISRLLATEMSNRPIVLLPLKEGVTDTVKMYAVRQRGKNVPYTNLTFFVDEAAKWLTYDESHHTTSEIVTVEIKPYNGVEK